MTRRLFSEGFNDYKQRVAGRVYARRCRPVRLLLALVLLGTWTTTAQAQGRDDGSIYSRFGVGELRTFSSSQAQGMGGGGTALWSFNYNSFNNPASWSRQVLVRAAAGFRVDALQTTDAADNTKNLTTGSFNAVQFGLPLLSNKLGVGLAFEPYSRVNYRVQTLGELVVDPTVQDTSAYQINYEGSGGLQQLRLGAGYRITEGLSLGASADLIFGIIEEGQRTTFAPPPTVGDPVFFETNVATSTRMFGVSATLGAVYTASNLLKEEDSFSIAASFSLPTTLNGDRALTLGESLDRDTLGIQVQGDVTLPLSVQAGLAYHTDNRLILVADARYEPWSQFESELSFPGYTPGDAAHFRDRLRLSSGLEWLPAGNSLLEPYFKRVAYRLGVYYDQAYITPQTDTEINTIAVTGGFSLPAMLAGTRLDVNFEVGTRGTTDHNLVRDVFYGFSATLNVGERWFVKQKLR